MKFYFDGKKNADFKISFQDLFSNKQYPFLEPICGESVGGFYCYLPIPYKKSCKIVLNGHLMKFYQIQYRNMPGYEIENFSTKLSQKEKSTLKEVYQVWQTSSKPDINTFAKGKSEKYQVEELSFSLPPDEERVIFQTNVPGRIVGFEINSKQNLHKDLSLNAIWDKEKNSSYKYTTSFFSRLLSRKTIYEWNYYRKRSRQTLLLPALPV